MSNTNNALFAINFEINVLHEKNIHAYQGGSGDGDLIRYEGHWYLLTLRIGCRKQDRWYAVRLSDFTSCRISFGGGRSPKVDGHVDQHIWSVAPTTWCTKTFTSKPKREAKARKQLRVTLLASYGAANDKHQGVRDRIGSRRLAGQQARAEGRTHWYWSEYGC